MLDTVQLYKETPMRANQYSKIAVTFMLISALVSVTFALPVIRGKSMNLLGQTKLYPVTSGSWGGQSIRFDIAKTGVTIEFDCADGQIPSELKADKQGRFKAEGTLTGRGAGPIRRDAVPQPMPALYEGTVKGNVMTLKVTLLKTNESAGEFTIERSKAPSLHRCY